MIYLGIYALMVVAFLKMIYGYIIGSVFSHDLLFFIPTLLKDTKNLPFLDSLFYILRLSSSVMDSISLKGYSMSALSLFGPLSQNFIFISLFFHCSNSLLLFFIGRQFNLNRRISFLSGLIYLTYFAHFDAYMWPMAFQHLIVVFFILLGLALYLKTDKLITKGGDYRFFYFLNLSVNAISSFCRFTILILPAVIIFHILFCSQDDKDRIKKYTIWMPIFVIHMVHPLAIWLFTGDWRLDRILRPFLLSIIERNGLLREFVSNINNLTKFSVLFLSLLCGLFIFRIALIAYSRYRHSLRAVVKWVAITMTIIAMVVLVYLGGLKRVLIPYNIIVPFVGGMTSFLNPLGNALLINSTCPYYQIPLQLSVFNFLLTLFMLVLFIKNFGRSHRSLLVALLVFYMVDMLFLYLWNPIASRYFIYFSPILCLIFCATFDYSYMRFAESVKCKAALKKICLILIFAGLCIPNLLAIKLSLLRGRTINTFFTYDYQRAAEMIKQDLTKSNRIKELRTGKGIYIDNILPLAVYFRKINNFSFIDTYNDNARFVFMQVFNDKYLNAVFNAPFKKDSDAIAYSLEGYHIKDIEGADIVPFNNIFDKAIQQLGSDRYEQALVSFKKAIIEERPYLLNYVLKDLPLEDLEWITNGYDMRTWINKMVDLHIIVSTGTQSPQNLAKAKYIAAIMHKEIDEFILCLFYFSFLEQSFGHTGESDYWFSQIRFLESDFSRLHSLLMQDRLIQSDKGMLSFLENHNSGSLYMVPENYRDRFRFDLFLFRLIKT